MSLAERFGGEIINGDALQMYEGLPITTNKMPVAERKGIPHHLLGCIKLSDEPWTVRQFCHSAMSAAEDIWQRGKLPILVGGTHYYLQSFLLRGARYDGAEVLRSPDTAEEERKWPILGASSASMWADLDRLDVESAQQCHPRDSRRVRHRLLQILQSRPSGSIDLELPVAGSAGEAAGVNSTMSDQGSEDSSGTSPELDMEPLVFWTHCEREQLIDRLEKRVEQMVSDGLLEEARELHDFAKARETQGGSIDTGRGIWIAIGYKEFLPFLESPENRSGAKRDHGIELTKIATRQYAKRQVQWIQHTLLPDAKKGGIDNRFFLLDSTDITRFSHDVEQQAMHITDSFLSGRTLPEPTSLSDTGSLMLASSKEKEQAIARYCKACDKTLMYQHTWDAHVQGRGHRRAIKPPNEWLSKQSAQRELGSLLEVHSATLEN